MYIYLKKYKLIGWNLTKMGIYHKYVELNMILKGNVIILKKLPKPLE